MLHTTPRIRFCTRAGISLALGMALLTGCAQAPQPPGYYDTPHDSTLADAQKHAQGGRGTRAPSQVQIGFGETEAERARRETQQAAPDTDAQTEPVDEADSAQAPAAASRDVRALREAKTFLGTVPCVHADADCPPMRMTLTLAPSGEWRARTVPV